MSICMKTVYFSIKLLKFDLWKMLKGEKSLVLACCTTFMRLPRKVTGETKNIVVAGNIQSSNFECSPYTASNTLDTDAMKRDS